MSALDDIFREYINMREHGLDSKEALRALRGYIDPLPQRNKERLAAQLKAWEAKQRNSTSTVGETTEKVSQLIRPLGKPRVNEHETGIPAPPTKDEQPLPAKEPPTDVWVECTNCSKRNRVKDVFCFSCGHMLEGAVDSYDTKHFSDVPSQKYNDEYYGPDSVMVLTTRTQARFELRPQSSSREVVLGRTVETQTVRPDIDLTVADAINLGVSRLHLSMTFDPSNNTIQIKDLGSANGSYVNGQKILPTERRVLRNGDELRLGRLALRVTFHHPGNVVR